MLSRNIRRVRGMLRSVPGHRRTRGPAFMMKIDRSDTRIDIVQSFNRPFERQSCTEWATSRALGRALEFFTTQINNDHTRKSYLNATRRFVTWCAAHGLHQLAD